MCHLSALFKNLLDIGIVIDYRANFESWEVNCFYLTKMYKLQTSQNLVLLQIFCVTQVNRLFSQIKILGSVTHQNFDFFSILNRF